MLTTILSTKNAVKFCLPVAASMLFFSTGCGRDNHNSCSACTSCASDTSMYQQPVEQVPTYSTLQQPQYAPPAMNVTQLAPTPNYNSGLRGPRSQAEIDAMFNTAQLQPLPPAPDRTQIPLTPPPLANGPVMGGDPSWNAPTTRVWRHIVVHHSASPTGSASSFDKAHKAKGWDGLGYHFVIGNGTGSGDGQVEVGYRWGKQQAGAHAGNYEYNQHGVGICLVGDFEKNGPPSPSQMASLRQLIGFLQQRSRIPTGSIIGHGSVPGRNTECPGRNLDMNALRASMSSAYSRGNELPKSLPAPALVVETAPVAAAPMMTVPMPTPQATPIPEMAIAGKQATVYAAKTTQETATSMVVKTVAKP